MRPLCLFLIVLSLSPGNLKAQVSTWEQPDTWIISNVTRTTSENVKGIPFLFEDYLKGSITLKNGRTIENIKINLKNQDNEMVVAKKYKGFESLYDVKEKDIVSFEITDATGQRHFIQKPNSPEFAALQQKGFYELLDQDSLLLKYAYKQFKKAEKAGGYNLGSSMDEHVLVTEYYLRLKAGVAYQNIKLSRKSIGSVLGPELSSQAKTLVKKNRWKWQNEEHVRLLIQAISNPGH